jgi:hypothetical protein
MNEAKSIFRTLKAAPTSPRVRFELHHPLKDEFHGEVARLEATYCFVARDGIGDLIYGHCDNLGEAWGSLSPKSRVIFRIAFTFAGPSAFDMRLEGA